MPFIPHTEEDINEMLAAIGVADIEDLFDEIPAELKIEPPADLPAALSEMEALRLMQSRARKDGNNLCFIGAGAYEHHIPAAVWEITTRGEFYSAYTPYQAEASQGTLQLIYEFQTLIANLMGMDVANASLYDGASGLAEAVLMAVRAQRSARKILIPKTVHPHYRRVVETIVKNQGIILETLDYESERGCIDPASLPETPEPFAALVIPQPNFFGVLEEVDALTDWAHNQGGLVIGVVNPTAMALLKPPGEWGSSGADIVCGEGQPMGVPLSSGGPYYGFMATKQKLVRQMPGRIVGRTVDLEGKPGFTLTLQAREQHIRRSKATSNICTNQGLVATASTIYMSLLGAQGLANVAKASHINTRKLIDKLTAISGVERAFNGACFHESVLKLSADASVVLAKLAENSVLGGYYLGDEYPELGNAILVCATETKIDEDLDTYAAQLGSIMETSDSSDSTIQPRW